MKVLRISYLINLN